jgi:hypothetical protein
VSCGKAGNCTGCGYVTSAAGKSQAFVVSHRNGRWAKAIEVPGIGRRTPAASPRSLRRDHFAVVRRVGRQHDTVTRGLKRPENPELDSHPLLARNAAFSPPALTR